MMSEHWGRESIGANNFELYFDGDFAVPQFQSSICDIADNPNTKGGCYDCLQKF